LGGALLVGGGGLVRRAAGRWVRGAAEVWACSPGCAFGSTPVGDACLVKALRSRSVKDSEVGA